MRRARARLLPPGGEMSSAAVLEPLVGRVISVITNDGRNIVGELKGFDQTTNLILNEVSTRAPRGLALRALRLRRLPAPGSHTNSSVSSEASHGGRGSENLGAVSAGARDVRDGGRRRRRQRRGGEGKLRQGRRCVRCVSVLRAFYRCATRLACPRRALGSRRHAQSAQRAAEASSFVCEGVLCLGCLRALTPAHLAALGWPPLASPRL